MVCPLSLVIGMGCLVLRDYALCASLHIQMNSTRYLNALR